MNPLTVVTGSIVKKYRLTNRLRSELGVSRQCAVPMQMKHLAVVKKSRLLESRNHLRQHITNFLELDENSTCLPSKRDAQKVDDEKVQKRVLNDYMHYLHMKYFFRTQTKKSADRFSTRAEKLSMFVLPLAYGMPLSASSEHVAQAPGTEVAWSCNSDECRRLHPGEHRRDWWMPLMRIS